MKIGNIGKFVYWNGYRVGRKEAGESEVLFDCVEQSKAQEIADMVFKDEYHDNFILGYERGYNIGVENNKEYRKIREAYNERYRKYGH